MAENAEPVRHASKPVLHRGFWRPGTSANFPCNSILAEEPPTKTAKSPGSTAQSCLFTSKYEKARRSSSRDMRLLSPGRKFTLAKPSPCLVTKDKDRWRSWLVVGGLHRTTQQGRQP